ncbi:MAG: hypothetical protein IPJ77_00355 [Planctomycetes bacterium]|nr:hypothetical protein [Planctomycetota bacterium]
MPPEVVLSSAGAAPRAPAFARTAEWLAERATPLLVKEVRQALRGRWFKSALLVSLALTTLAGFIVLGVVIPLSEGQMNGYEGLILFGACFSATAIGAAGIVPFAAFSSMNAEAEENTLELLLLSNLSPLEIVLGKLGSSVLQALLVCSTALPFAVVAWNLGGLPPSVLVLAPLFTVLGSACFSAIGIALSTLSRTRWVRVVLMVLFGFFLFNFAQNVLLFAFLGAAAAFLPGAGGVPLVEFSVAGSILSVAFLGVAATFASDLLSHREESGSTPMRRVVAALTIVGAVAVALCGAVSTGGGSAFGVGSSAGSAPLGVIVLGAVLAVIALPLAWCCTESEALPLGARARPPRRGVMSGLGLLFVSGGGRGAWLATAAFGLLGFAHVVGSVVGARGWSASATQGLVLLLTAWIWLLLPSVVFSPFTARLPMRLAARAALWFFPWIAFLGTSLVFVALRGPGVHAMENAANPFWLMQAIDSTGRPEDAAAGVLLVLTAGVTLAANGWRMFQSVREVRSAMTERDALERKVLDAAPQS